MSQDSDNSALTRVRREMRNFREKAREVVDEFTPPPWGAKQIIVLALVAGVSLYTANLLYRKVTKQPQKRSSLAGINFGLIAQRGTKLRLSLNEEQGLVMLEEASNPSVWHFDKSAGSSAKNEVYRVSFGKECNHGDEMVSSLSMNENGELGLTAEQSANEDWEIKADSSDDKRFFLRNVGRSRLLEARGAPLVLEFLA